MKRILFFVMLLAAVSCAAFADPGLAPPGVDVATEVVADEPGLLKDGVFWDWVIGILIAGFTFLQGAVPTGSKTHSLSKVAIKVLEVARWLIMKIFPDRKKGGGLHEDPGAFPLKKKK